MEETRRKKLDLIFWHLRDIGYFLREKSLFPEARRRLSYVVTYGMISTYVVDAVTQDCVLEDVEPLLSRDQKERLAPGAIDQPPLYIFPFVKSDSCIHPDVAEHIARTKCATYSPLYDCISLNLECPETARFMATSLLHEAGHAWEAWMEDRLGVPNNRPDPVRLEEERKMWLFDCRLAQTLGGSKLKRAMDKTIPEIIKAHVTGTYYKPPLGIGKPLDLCYRPVSTKEERRGRDWLYITFCDLLAANRLKDPAKILRHQLHVVGIICKEKYEGEKKAVALEDTQSL